MKGRSLFAYCNDEQLILVKDETDGLGNSKIESFSPGTFISGYLAIPNNLVTELLKAFKHSSFTQALQIEATFTQYGIHWLFHLLRKEFITAPSLYLRRQLNEKHNDLQAFYQALLEWHHTQITDRPLTISAFPNGIDNYLRRSLRSQRRFIQQSGKETLVSVYRIDDVSDLLHLDSLLLFSSEAYVNQCSHCKRFFIHQKDKRFKYCTWPDQIGEGCRARGAQKRHDETIENDPLLKAYRRIYRKHYARHERLLNRTSTHEENVSEMAQFQEWSKKARQVRQQYLSSEIDHHEYLNRLNDLDQTTIGP